MQESVYEPREDSFLLAKEVLRYARGRVLDMGTGSGIQAVTAAGSPRVVAVDVADVSRRALAHCRDHLRHPKIVRMFQSDLFSDVPGEYDTITFNAPYLPWEPGLPSTIVGGRKGWEIIDRFLRQAVDHLKLDGQVLLLFSSITNKAVVDSLILREGYEAEPLAKQHMGGFETLYVYRLVRQPVLEALRRKGYRNIIFLARGKRGVVYTATWKNAMVCIKIKRADSEAIGRLQNEAVFLKKVNRKGIGPKLLKAGEGFVIYRYVPGTYLKDWLPKAGKAQARSVLLQLLDQARTMDTLKMAKEEMLRPLKNALVQDGLVTLIDFERAHHSTDAKNVTQLCQFIRGRAAMLRQKGIQIDQKQLMAAARAYKRTPSPDAFRAIQALVNP